MHDHDQTTPQTGTPRRSRARKNVIAGSPNRDEYVRMMTAGWSSTSIERYAAYRYGEDIPAGTIRAYRVRWKIEPVKIWSGVTPDQVLDVVERRAQLIALQEKRIGIDVQHEEDMRKLFGSTRAEIGLLSQLLSEHKADLQDLGLMPKAGERIEISTPREKAGVPRAMSLAEVFGVEPGVEADLARVLHMSTKGRSNGGGNGQVGA